MPNILTVTANTAIDHFLEVEQLQLGDTVLAKSSDKFAAGKGVNVAKAVASCQHPVSALGFVGKPSQAEFAALNSAVLKTDFIFVDEQTRSNMTLSDNAINQETHIRTSGYHVREKDCQRLLEKLDECINKNDIVVLSGSLPEGAPEHWYQQAIACCHRQSALVFVDSSGAPFAESLQAKPDLVKPNLTELEQWIGRSLEDEQAILTAAKQVIHSGAQSVVVSRGEKGVIAVSDTQALAAGIINMQKNIISRVGCGDALVAGLAIAALKKSFLSDGVKFGMACATANLFSNEPGCFDAQLAENLQSQVVIRYL